MQDWQPHPDSKSLRAIYCNSQSKTLPFLSQLLLDIIFMFIEPLPCARHSKRWYVLRNRNDDEDDEPKELRQLPLI